MSRLDPGQLLLSRRALEIQREPFCFFSVDDFLPGALYESLLASYPSGDAALTANDDKRQICLPQAGNRPDELRWAFVRWAHQHWKERHKPAAHGLLRALKAVFPCK